MYFYIAVLNAAYDPTAAARVVLHLSSAKASGKSKHEDLRKRPSVQLRGHNTKESNDAKI